MARDCATAAGYQSRLNTGLQSTSTIIGPRPIKDSRSVDPLSPPRLYNVLPTIPRECMILVVLSRNAPAKVSVRYVFLQLVCRERARDNWLTLFFKRDRCYSSAFIRIHPLLYHTFIFTRRSCSNEFSFECRVSDLRPDLRRIKEEKNIFDLALGFTYIWMAIGCARQSNWPHNRSN